MITPLFDADEVNVAPPPPMTNTYIVYAYNRGWGIPSSTARGGYLSYALAENAVSRLSSEWVHARIFRLGEKERT